MAYTKSKEPTSTQEAFTRVTSALTLVSLTGLLGITDIEIQAKVLTALIGASVELATTAARESLTAQNIPQDVADSIIADVYARIDAVSDAELGAMQANMAGNNGKLTPELFNKVTGIEDLFGTRTVGR